MFWAKEQGYWKIVSYEVEPEEAADQGSMPDIRTASEIPEPERKPGAPGLTDATEAFLEAWLVEKDIDKALDFVAPSAYPCVNLNLDPGRDAKATAEEQAARNPSGIGAGERGLGYGVTAGAIMNGVEPATPNVYIVTHPREEAYSLLGVPDWMANDGMCRSGC